ncbi:MAG: Quercetin 2,3-dioxygenase [Planctomycetes bacterium]|nr:Quercetin 2,3-dioxygenase [Planctomycetota bacterium]
MTGATPITVRRAADRGATRLPWLDSRHTFSFAEYRDPAHMGFRALRVLNDDRVHPASGFEPHAHRDMEIVSIVLSGALQHRDSLGNGSVIRPGEIQRMTAGAGIVHSEWNPSETDEVRFLQIWLRPLAHGVAPGYDQRPLPTVPNTFARIVAGRDTAHDGAVAIDSAADLWIATLDGGASAAVAPRRGAAWVHVATGDVELAADGARAALAAGDGAPLPSATRLELTARSPSQVLVFDLG